MQSIERRSRVDAQAFRLKYLAPHRPVVLTDAVVNWPALNWTPEHLRNTCGDRTVVTYEARSLTDAKPESCTLREAIDAILASTPDRPARYLSTFPLHKLPELHKDMLREPSYLADNWLISHYLPHPAVDLFVGAPGSMLRNIHHERIHHHSFTVMLYGRKRFFLYPPSATPHMYAYPGLDRHRSLVNDPITPDLARFPLFAKAECFTCELEPGEMIFIPAGWWHTSKALTVTINVGYCFANETNISVMIRELAARIREEGLRAFVSRYGKAPVCCSPVSAAVLLLGLEMVRKQRLRRGSILDASETSHTG